MSGLLRVVVLVGLLVSLSAAPGGRLAGLIPLVGSTQVAHAAWELLGPVDPATSAAIRQVIQRSNEEQVRAIAARDPSVMADTVTEQHYAELVSINQDLLDNGVIAIGLVKIDWGAISITENTATATTFETWSTAFSDGTTSRSRDQNEYALVLDNGSWKISADSHPGQGPTGLSTPPSTQPQPGQSTDPNTSHNWSGYAATGDGFSGVRGTWTVPQFNGSDPSFGIDAAWVGIGGVTSHDLIQAGTQETISGSGRSQYQAWIETLPQPARTVPLRVHPGDSISVSIDEQGTNNWLIHFANNTTGAAYDETVRYRSTHSSAEWVEEAPSAARGGVLPLSNFGTIDFTAGAAVKNGQTVTIATAGASAITMVNETEQALAVPSPLAADGSSFSVARTEVASTLAAAPAQSRGPRQWLP